MISGFLREVDENRPLLGYYAASSGNLLRTFRDKLSVQSSRVKKRKPVLRQPGFLVDYRALFLDCRALFLDCRALFLDCRPLFLNYRALFLDS